jgi:hypothetical protein
MKGSVVDVFDVLPPLEVAHSPLGQTGLHSSSSSSSSSSSFTYIRMGGRGSCGSRAPSPATLFMEFGYENHPHLQF